MASVLDVASYVLEKSGAMTAWKLQKLVYYCQAWSLVWDERPLFKARIEAWANGPVCPELYRSHRGQFLVDKIGGGNPRPLGKDARETIDAVLKYYGGMTSQELRNLTHMEEPWKNARGDTPYGVCGTSEISHDSMALYYEGVQPDYEGVQPTS